VKLLSITSLQDKLMPRDSGFEYRVIKKYEKMGWQCMRSAGSHGIADIIAYKKGEKDHLIQCKNVRAKRLWKREKLELILHCETHDKVPIWAWNARLPNRKYGKTIIVDLRQDLLLQKIN
jgi:Holliday junction resolvase